MESVNTKQLLLISFEFMESYADDVFILKTFLENDINPLSIILRQQKNLNRVSFEKWLIEYDNIQFFMLFRMEKKTLELLVNVLERMDHQNILNKAYTGGHTPLSIQLKVLIFVWYMATQESLVPIADRFNVSHTSVMNIVYVMLYFMLKLKKEYIKFPETIEDKETVAAGFDSYPSKYTNIHILHCCNRIMRLSCIFIIY